MKDILSEGLFDEISVKAFMDKFGKDGVRTLVQSCLDMMKKKKMNDSMFEAEKAEQKVVNDEYDAV